MAQARPYGDYGRVVNWRIDELLVSYERERLDVEERGKRVAVAARSLNAWYNAHAGEQRLIKYCGRY